MSVKARAWTGTALAMAIALIAVVVVNGQTRRQDPYLAFVFKVTIEGQPAGSPSGFFKSVSGLSVETEVVDYREGGVNDVTRKLAGATKFANIRLTREFTGDRSLFEWAATIQRPNPARVNGRITMFDRQGRRIAAWKFINAFPVKWEGPDFDAAANDMALETIEIAHEGLTFADDEE